MAPTCRRIGRDAQASLRWCESGVGCAVMCARVGHWPTYGSTDLLEDAVADGPRWLGEEVACEADAKDGGLNSSGFIVYHCVDRVAIHGLYLHRNTHGVASSSWPGQKRPTRLFEGGPLRSTSHSNSSSSVQAIATTPLSQHCVGRGSHFSGCGPLPIFVVPFDPFKCASSASSMFHRHSLSQRRGEQSNSSYLAAFGGASLDVGVRPCLPAHPHDFATERIALSRPRRDPPTGVVVDR